MDVLTAVEVDQYALVGTAITATFRAVDQDGEPDTSLAAPTVSCVNSVGTAVTVGAVTETADDSAIFQATIAAADNSQVDELTVTWTTGGVARTTTIGVIGAWPFSYADLAAFDKSVQSRALTDFLPARRETISELVGIAHKSPVPMFATARIWNVDGNGARLPHTHVTAVRSVAEIDEDGDETLYTVAQLAEVAVTRSGVLYRKSGAFTRSRDLKIHYVHGVELPPQYLKRAMMLRCVWHMNQSSSNLMERVTSWSTGEGGTYRYDSATVKKTGMPNVDGAYQRFAGPNFGFA